MAYRLVRSLVYKRGVGIRETVWVGVWFGKTNSVGVPVCVCVWRRSWLDLCVCACVCIYRLRSTKVVRKAAL